MTPKTGFTKVLSKRTRRVYGGLRCHAAVAAGAGAAAVLAGCGMGPDYKRPDVAVPNGWRMDYQGAANTANTAWWEGFQDAQLDAMIQEALKNNYDVRVAAARVEEFRAALQVSKSDEYPQLGYESQVGRDRTSQNRQVPLPGNVAPIYYQ